MTFRADHGVFVQMGFTVQRYLWQPEGGFPMSEQKEVYLIVVDHPSDDCSLPHALVYGAREEAENDIPKFSKGSTVKIYRAKSIGERV